MRVIGVTGVVRAGKNLFSAVAREILTQRGHFVVEMSIASELKSDLYDLIKSKTGIDTFTEKDDEKEIIRPMMIAHGNMMRKLTEGKHWTGLLEQKMYEKYSDADYVLIPDIRFAEYIEDELYWLKYKMDGKLVHISRKVEDASGNKSILLPPNMHEQENDPKMNAAADYRVIWDTVNSKSHENMYIRDNVLDALDYLA